MQRLPVISIHAAREGGDYAFVIVFRFTDISIHAAREGGDRKRLPRAHKAGYFNPRRP